MEALKFQVFLFDWGFCLAILPLMIPIILKRINHPLLFILYSSLIFPNLSEAKTFLASTIFSFSSLVISSSCFTVSSSSLLSKFFFCGRNFQFR